VSDPFVVIMNNKISLNQTGGRWSRENTNPKMRESRGRTRHTLGRENEVPRIVQRRDEYDRERGH
jgi:hypothetical protein